MVIISLGLTRMNPDRNIFAINMEQTSFYIHLCLYTAINEQRQPLSRHSTTMFSGTHFSYGLTQNIREHCTNFLQPFFSKFIDFAPCFFIKLLSITPVCRVH